VVRGKIPASILILAALLSCRSLETRSWGECTDADGFGLGSDVSGVFDWSGWPDMVTAIDGGRCVAGGATGYKWARLKSGIHVVDYSNYVHDFGHVSGRIEIGLQAGHRYVFGFDACYWCKPRRYAVWVSDENTGEVVWGRRADWPRWFL
jgi:hypothetical protein